MEHVAASKIILGISATGRIHMCGRFKEDCKMINGIISNLEPQFSTL